MSGRNYNLYSCELCTGQIDIKSANCLRLVTCWVKGTSRSMAEQVTDHYRYVHDFCLAGQKDKSLGQDSLF
jgi:hypothetical protein